MIFIANALGSALVQLYSRRIEFAYSRSRSFRGGGKENTQMSNLPGFEPGFPAYWAVGSQFHHGARGLVQLDKLTPCICHVLSPASQRGAILATELKNNSAKLAKWTAQAILAGSDQMKIG